MDWPPRLLYSIILQDDGGCLTLLVSRPDEISIHFYSGKIVDSFMVSQIFFLEEKITVQLAAANINDDKPEKTEETVHGDDIVNQTGIWAHYVCFLGDAIKSTSREQEEMKKIATARPFHTTLYRFMKPDYSPGHSSLAILNGTTETLNANPALLENIQSHSKAVDLSIV